MPIFIAASAIIENEHVLLYTNQNTLTIIFGSLPFTMNQAKKGET